MQIKMKTQHEMKGTHPSFHDAGPRAGRFALSASLNKGAGVG